MCVKMMVVAFAAIGLSTWVMPAAAQHEGHQIPGMAVPANANVGACAENAKTVSGALDQVNARVEDARQLNDPAKLRGAVGDLQIVLTQMKAQLADCIALNSAAPAGAGMPNMAGTDHSKMQMPPSVPVMQPGSTNPPPAEVVTSHANMPGMDHSKMNIGSASNPAAPGQSTSKSAQTNALDITFKSEPSPLRTGDNRFEVVVKDKSGKPVSDAAVSLAFYLAPMPSMQMPAMRNTVKLTSAGNGAYRGEGSVGMAGAWDVTITVTRGPQQLGSKKVKVTAR